MATQTKKPASQLKSARPELPKIAHQLHSLLHTVRVIEQFEEQLCSILHAMTSAGKVSPALTRELRLLLEEIPSTHLQMDLDTIREALDPPLPSTTKPSPKSGKSLAAKPRQKAKSGKKVARKTRRT